MDPNNNPKETNLSPQLPSSNIRPASRLLGNKTKLLGAILIIILLALAYFIIRNIIKTKTNNSLYALPPQENLAFRPNGPGASTQWTSQHPQTGSHWDKVAEAKADDDTTYIEASSSNLLDVYTYSSQKITAGSSIKNVTVCARAKYVTSGAHNTVAPALMSGTKPAWEDKTVGPVYNNYCSVWTTDPSTNNPWTIESVNNLQFGVKKSFAGTTVRVTQIYMLINYEPPQK